MTRWRWTDLATAWVLVGLGACLVALLLSTVACVATTQRRGPAGEVEGTATTVYAPPGLGGAGAALDGALGGLGGSEVLRTGAGLLGVPDWLTEAVLALGVAGLGVAVKKRAKERDSLADAYIGKVEEQASNGNRVEVLKAEKKRQDDTGIRHVVRKRLKAQS